jgi:hypothetical protein
MEQLGKSGVGVRSGTEQLGTDIGNTELLNRVIWRALAKALLPALTNEVVLRLLRREIEGKDPQVLLMAGLLEMWRILIDYGRRWQLHRQFTKKEVNNTVHLVMLLDQLKRIDARARGVVELRFFVGLSVKETAALLGISMRTVNEDSEFALSWPAKNWGNAL